jgi:hypothetical protein
MYVKMSDRSHESFTRYLRFCVNEVGSRRASARGHFRTAGIDVDGIY